MLNTYTLTWEKRYAGEEEAMKERTVLLASNDDEAIELLNARMMKELQQSEELWDIDATLELDAYDHIAFRSRTDLDEPFSEKVYANYLQRKRLMNDNDFGQHNDAIHELVMKEIGLMSNEAEQAVIAYRNW